jgi:hypothetical protein
MGTFVDWSEVAVRLASVDLGDFVHWCADGLASTVDEVVGGPTRRLVGRDEEIWPAAAVGGVCIVKIWSPARVGGVVDERDGLLQIGWMKVLDEREDTIPGEDCFLLGA